MMEHAAAEFDLEKLGRWVQRIGTGLLTTIHADGFLHTRPVQTLRFEATGDLWFFTDWHSPKVGELERDTRACVAYADSVANVYVAISGVGHLIRDAEKAKQLWSIEQRAYYPEGPSDPRLAILRVSIERGEYWAAPGRLSYLFAAAKATVTGTPATIIGENFKLPERGS
jgi:general stress protein 26